MDPKESTSHGPAHTAGDNNPDLNALLDDMRDAGMKVTKEWKDIWSTAIKYAWGQQLEGWTLKESWEYIVVNRIYPLMFQTISKLAKNNPKILTFPRSSEKRDLDDFVEKWAGILQHIWESPYKLAMRPKLIMGLLICAVYGYMVGYTYWDPKLIFDQEKKEWEGDVRETFIHPAHFWADPSAESMDTAESCGMFRIVKMEWAINRWPKFKEQIEAQAFTSDDEKYYASDVIVYEYQKGATLENIQRRFSKIVNLIFKGSTKHEQDNKESKQKYVNIEQTYWKDYSERHVKIEDNVPVDSLVKNGKAIVEETTGLVLDPKTKKPIEDWPKYTKAEYDEPKFPTGRFVLRIGRTILNPEEEDQVYKESRWPFTVMPYHILPFMWQGCNAVEMSRNNNDMLNITISSLVNQVRRTADPTKLVEAGALARNRKGKPKTKKEHILGLGKIVVMARNKIRAMINLPELPIDPAVYELAKILKSNIDDQMFMQPIARGAQTDKKMTATEAARQDTSSHDYTALQAIFLDIWIDNTATRIAEICQRYYKPGRLAAMVTDDGRESLVLSQEYLDVRFDVNIEPGSTLPFDEAQKKDDYMVAYKILGEPVPNPLLEEMLRILNIAKRKEILKKHQGYQLFLQFIQMGQMLTQLPPEQVQAFIEASGVPQLQQLAQLLIEAGQLVPQKGEAA